MFALLPLGELRIVARQACTELDQGYGLRLGPATVRARSADNQQTVNQGKKKKRGFERIYLRQDLINLQYQLNFWSLSGAEEGEHTHS